MNTLKMHCPCIEIFLTRLKSDDTNYLNPFKWNINCPNCFNTKDTTNDKLEIIRKEIEEIKKLNNYNVNPLCEKSDDTIIDINIKESIIVLKTDLQKFNEKLNKIEQNINTIGTEPFCFIEKE